jgi:hypothetical protein
LTFVNFIDSLFDKLEDNEHANDCKENRSSDTYSTHNKQVNERVGVGLHDNKLLLHRRKLSDHICNIPLQHKFLFVVHWNSSLVEGWSLLERINARGILEWAKCAIRSKGINSLSIIG